MHKVKIFDMNQERQVVENSLKPHKTRKRKKIFIKINDSLFEIGFRKGLIEKNDEGYCFIGDYGELIAFKNNKPTKDFVLLD